MNNEASNLAAWSRAVRESSLKRLRLIPTGRENWRPVPEAMSFADVAHHLAESDLWLSKKLQVRTLEPIHGRVGVVQITSRDEYLKLLRRLEQTGVKRSELIERLSNEELSEHINDQRFGGEVTVWWVIVRGNLDHETHHRGQIAAYLRMAHISVQ
jgi:uncharacterized damage-inducible protein DinB